MFILFTCEDRLLTVEEKQSPTPKCSQQILYAFVTLCHEVNCVSSSMCRPVNTAGCFMRSTRSKGVVRENGILFNDAVNRVGARRNMREMTQHIKTCPAPVYLPKLLRLSRSSTWEDVGQMLEPQLRRRPYIHIYFIFQRLSRNISKRGYYVYDFLSTRLSAWNSQNLGRKMYQNVRLHLQCVIASEEIGLDENAEKTKYVVMSRDQNARKINNKMIVIKPL